MTQDKVATAAMFIVLAFSGDTLTLLGGYLCFTSSERLYGGEWKLREFGNYMLSRCPAPYGLSNPTDLYPNATAGGW